ncbi:RagB/SusD family nutrient uptake outer membrane protein [Salinimicrobium sp. GXAS 041]|uniref:RagB/SusD family nutrient uptake outer membrane protein n=1 Tax=Salinimicrobium sp. GXAS 041 TaxID=3400806 RepID=UPI003C777635
MKNSIKIFIVGLLCIATVSCGDDFLENEQFSTTPQNIESVDDMYALMYGAYIEARSSVYYGRDVIIYGSLRGNDAYNDAGSGRFRGTAYYNMTASDGYATDTYAQAYDIVAQLNVIINSDFVNENRTAEIANVRGQALVLRANIFSDLLKLYGEEHTGGDLGISLMTEYDTEAKPARATVAESHAQIMQDFEEGISLLEESGIGSTSVKDLINVYSAKGLAARYYLYHGEDASLQKAYDYSSDVIESGAYRVVGEDLYVNSFEQNLTAGNSIFEIAVGTQANLGTTSIAYMYSDLGYGDINIRPEFVQEFDGDDVRLELIDGVDVLKYPNIQGENSIKLLRYEEILLTRAEANLRLQIDEDEAMADVNAVVVNRGLEAYETITIEDVLEQRRKELFFEGQRYFDMLRLGMDIPAYNADGVLVETLEYDSDPRLAFPIPQRELDVNPNVVPNPGY